jgi:hypothetical protein
VSVSLQLILKTIAPFWPFIISGLSEDDISMLIMFGLSSWKSFSVESLFGVPNNFKQLARVNNIAKNILAFYYFWII